MQVKSSINLSALAENIARRLLDDATTYTIVDELRPVCSISYDDRQSLATRLHALRARFYGLDTLDLAVIVHGELIAQFTITAPEVVETEEATDDADLPY